MFINVFVGPITYIVGIREWRRRYKQILNHNIIKHRCNHKISLHGRSYNFLKILYNNEKPLYMLTNNNYSLFSPYRTHIPDFPVLLFWRSTELPKEKQRALPQVCD